MAKEKNQEIIKIHIYDFLIKCRINRNQHNIFLKKFESQGLKTIEEWSKLTGLSVIQ